MRVTLGRARASLVERERHLQQSIVGDEPALFVAAALCTLDPFVVCGRSGCRMRYNPPKRRVD